MSDMRYVRYVLDGEYISYDDLIYLLYTAESTMMIALKDIDTDNHIMVFETYNYLNGDSRIPKFINKK